MTTITKYGVTFEKIELEAEPVYLEMKRVARGIAAAERFLKEKEVGK